MTVTGEKRHPETETKREETLAPTLVNPHAGSILFLFLVAACGIRLVEKRSILGGHMVTSR